MSGYGRALPRRAGAWRGKKWIGGCHDKLASKQVYTSVFATEAEAVTALAALRTRTEAAFDAEMQRRYAAASQSTPTLADLSCTRLGRRKAADAEPQKPGRRGMQHSILAAAQSARVRMLSRQMSWARAAGRLSEMSLTVRRGGALQYIQESGCAEGMVHRDIPIQGRWKKADYCGAVLLLLERNDSKKAKRDPRFCKNVRKFGTHYRRSDSGLGSHTPQRTDHRQATWPQHLARRSSVVAGLRHSHAGRRIA